MTCLFCPARVNARGMCSNHYKIEQRAGRIDNYPRAVSASVVTLEEVEFMLSCGESPAAVVAVLRMRPGTIGRAVTRAGRKDLARPFWSLAHRERTAA